MNEQEALNKMIAPGTPRARKYKGGVIQILITSSCNLSCYNCTQASHIRRKPWFMSPEHFEQAVLSLKGYWGVVGVFGGNPAIHPQFDMLCGILRQHIPYEQRGIWCNHPLGKGHIMRQTFNPRVSNLNVHVDDHAYQEFKDSWPTSMPFGLTNDSRHSPPWIAMKDVLWKECNKCLGTGYIYLTIPNNVYPEFDQSFVDTMECTDCDTTGKVYDEDKAWELISQCDINQHWSAGIGVFRGQLRAWFCEIAMAQSILHQDNPEYPDTSIDPTKVYDHNGDTIREPSDSAYRYWWQLPMSAFRDQVRKHCHECGIPLRGYGENAQSTNPHSREQASKTHEEAIRPKIKGRPVEVVTELVQLGMDKISNVTRYLQNAGR